MSKIKFVTFFAILIGSSACSPKGDFQISDTQGVYFQNCPASQKERSIWKSAFKSYVAIRLLDNYMDCSGLMVRLSKQEMADLHPRISVRDAAALSASIHNGKLPSGPQTFVSLGSAFGGTLGVFTVKYTGEFYIDSNGAYGKKGQWVFMGTANFIDTWDFDPRRNSHRSAGGEKRTRIANAFLTGTPFEVRSETISILQLESEKYARLEIPAKIPEPDYSEIGKMFGEARDTKN